MPKSWHVLRIALCSLLAVSALGTALLVLCPSIGEVVWFDADVTAAIEARLNHGGETYRIIDRTLIYRAGQMETYLFLTDQDLIGSSDLIRGPIIWGDVSSSTGLSFLPFPYTEHNTVLCTAAHKLIAYSADPDSVDFSSVGDGYIDPATIEPLDPVTLTRADGTPLTLYLACADIAE
ncbi:MAG: hypothetical protein Q4C72_05250 [Eubacteriales bacterium]|nr:hypothetical protein [Eubacteriales bacterium]